MDLRAARTAMHELYAVVAAPSDEGGAGSFEVDALLETVEVTQQIINIANAIQTRAIAHVAAHDEVRDDDVEQGWSWRRHGLGFVAEDAPGLVSPRLGISAPVAARRVETAVHQVTVTPQLVDAMGAGDVDEWRATVVTRELSRCPDEVAHEIADRLVDRFGRQQGWVETAGPLGARTRRLVARLAPEVGKQEAERAHKDRSLARHVVSAAADQWVGLVPVEQSLVMWQAVDSLARELRLQRPALTLEQARVDALAQLILQQADVTLHLHATTAADGARGESESAPHTAADAQTRSDATGRGGVLELGGLGRPGTTRVDLDRLSDGVRLVASTGLSCHEDTGAILAGVVPKSLAPCDLTPPAADAVEERYRPSPALQRLVRLRDGHCRFPGCQASARSCDIDHVTPWPRGATTAANLMCLCRRHHRVKQRPGWSVRLDPDGIAHWTDPSGRATDTHPVDHLDRLDVPRPAPLGRKAADTSGDTSSGHGDAPGTIQTLLEMSLDRFLELTSTAARGPAPVSVDWVVDPAHGRPVLVDLDTWAPPGPDTPPF